MGVKCETPTSLLANVAEACSPLLHVDLDPTNSVSNVTGILLKSSVLLKALNTFAC